MEKKEVLKKSGSPSLTRRGRMGALLRACSEVQEGHKLCIFSAYIMYATFSNIRNLLAPKN